MESEIQELEHNYFRHLPCEADDVTCPRAAVWLVLPVGGLFDDGSNRQLLCDECRKCHIEVLEFLHGDQWTTKIKYIEL